MSVWGIALRGIGRALRKGKRSATIKSVKPTIKNPVGTFRSWPSEVIRTTTNILKGKK